MTTDTLHGRAENPPPRYYDPLPIGPAEVRAGVDRELRALADFGLPDVVAVDRAIAITAGKIRNSALLAESQAHAGRCHHCAEALDDLRPVVAVLGAAGRLWMHGGACHGEFSRRRAALVDEIMRSAGFGLDQRMGEAA